MCLLRRKLSDRYVIFFTVSHFVVKIKVIFFSLSYGLSNQIIRKKNWKILQYFTRANFNNLFGSKFEKNYFITKFKMIFW